MDYIEELISFHARRGNAELVSILRAAVDEFLSASCEYSGSESEECSSDSEEESFNVHIDDNGFQCLV